MHVHLNEDAEDERINIVRYKCKSRRSNNLCKNQIGSLEKWQKKKETISYEQWRQVVLAKLKERDLSEQETYIGEGFPFVNIEYDVPPRPVQDGDDGVPMDIDGCSDDDVITPMGVDSDDDDGMMPIVVNDASSICSDVVEEMKDEMDCRCERNVY